MEHRVPALFVSHGLPTMAILEDEYSEALEAFGKTLPPLRGVIVVSSQWLSPGPIQVTAAADLKTHHNFYGYQEEIYDLQYGAQGSMEQALMVIELLEDKNLEAVVNVEAGLDHGAWMPLRRILPDPKIPITQLSLPMFVSPRVVMNIGHALAELRKAGYLFIGSGGAAFNPSKISWSSGTINVNSMIKDFSEWLKLNFLEAKVEDLVNYDTLAPHAAFAHPTQEYILPLFFIMGSALAGDHPGVVFDGYRYHSQSLLTVKLSERSDDQKIETLQ